MSSILIAWRQEREFLLSVCPGLNRKAPLQGVYSNGLWDLEVWLH